MLRILLFISFFICSVFAQVDAKLEIVKKTGGVLPRVAIGIASNTSEIDTLSKVKKALAQDLLVSGHFEVVESQVGSVSYESSPDLITLANQGIDLFINLTANGGAGSSYTLLAKFYDVNAKALFLEKNFTTSQEARYPFLAHNTAIAINDYFKAPSIAWMNRFVIMSVYRGSGKADIVIGDYTLQYKKTIISGGLNIFPKWADAEQKSIYYTSYNYEKPTLVKLNIYNKQKEVVMQSNGMIACSDVNADGSKILITAAPNSQPDIYLYNTRSRSKTNLTNYGGIDVGGQFIEDDSRIVFVSDRLGNPNIFVKSIGSSGVERLVYHGKNNTSATAFKNFIVYSGKDESNELGRSFNLYLISTKSAELKRLTSSGINQFPKFSLDGESLLYIKNDGRSSVGIIRLDFNKSFLFPINSGKIQSIDW